VNINKIAILGSGSMGTAILSGLLKAGFDAGSVSVSTKSLASANKLATELGVTAYSAEQSADANSLAAAGADVVLVAVKPMYITQVLSEVSDALSSDALVISVAAGITNAAMEAAVPNSVAVIRAMPNTPAIVGRAVTGLARGSRVADAQLNSASSLFETVGKVVVLDESQIDALTSISGSGPAYVFYLIEQLTSAALELGFDESTANLLVSETFLGASELLVASGKAPADLRRQVTSPNGTTERAIAVLSEGGLAQLFKAATEAAVARAKQISAGN
jgi:pyrroline-5-carboxylate reductase